MNEQTLGVVYYDKVLTTEVSAAVLAQRIHIEFITLSQNAFLWKQKPFIS